MTSDKGDKGNTSDKDKKKSSTAYGDADQRAMLRARGRGIVRQLGSRVVGEPGKGRELSMGT